MKTTLCFIRPFPALSVLLLFSLLLHAQYREYVITGKILNKDGNALPGVEIQLRDKETARSFSMKTDDKGDFKLAGLPHGIYEASITKQGYQSRTEEWNFAAPQERMQKSEIPPIRLLTRDQVEQIETSQELRTEFTEAKEKIQKQDFDGALIILKKMLDKDPKDPNALYLSGICDFEREKYPEAIELFNRVCAINPKFAGAYIHLGLCHQKLKDQGNAILNYQKSLDLDPNNLVSVANLGFIYYEQGKVAEAIPLLELALKQKPDDEEILETTGLCYVNQGNFPKALDDLEKAKSLTKNPDKIQTLDTLIESLKAQAK